MRFFHELKRRRVVRVAIVYTATPFVVRHDDAVEALRNGCQPEVMLR